MRHGDWGSCMKRLGRYQPGPSGTPVELLYCVRKFRHKGPCKDRFGRPWRPLKAPCDHAGCMMFGLCPCPGHDEGIGLCAFSRPRAPVAGVSL